MRVRGLLFEEGKKQYKMTNFKYFGLLQSKKYSTLFIRYRCLTYVSVPFRRSICKVITYSRCFGAKNSELAAWLDAVG